MLLEITLVQPAISLQNLFSLVAECHCITETLASTPAGKAEFELSYGSQLIKQSSLGFFSLFDVPSWNCKEIFFRWYDSVHNGFNWRWRRKQNSAVQITYSHLTVITFLPLFFFLKNILLQNQRKEQKLSSLNVSKFTILPCRSFNIYIFTIFQNQDQKTIWENTFLFGWFWRTFKVLWEGAPFSVSLRKLTFFQAFSWKGICRS